MTARSCPSGYGRGVDGSTFWERLRRVDPLIWDSLLAGLILMLSIVGAVVGPKAAPSGARQAPDLEVYLLLVLGCVPLAFRRRAPIGVLVFVGVATVALALRDHSPDLFVSLAVASYTGSAHVERERFLRTVLPTAIAAGVLSQVLAYPSTKWVEVVIGATFTAGLPMIFGRIGFNRRRRIAVDRERAARDAVIEERARIAREMHDVVAHAMSVMIVQAGAARRVVDSDADAAKAAIARIEATGRDGMNEMRRLIRILTSERDGPEHTPQPGLGQLDALVDTVRGAGVPVEVVTEGTPRELPSGLDLIAFRVVQEALTNVIKHAGRANARVLLRWTEDALDLEVADDGRGASAPASPGHGLLGMSERTALYGGSLETLPRPGGGFVLRVHLPFDAPFDGALST